MADGTSISFTDHTVLLVEVSSEDGKGSIFSLSMPYVKAYGDSHNRIQSGDEIKQSNVNADTAVVVTKLSGNILLAEDNLMNQQLIQRMLERTGANVTIAENGAIAVQLAQQTAFDLIFMDMQMPVLSGLDAVRTLRAMNYQAPSSCSRPMQRGRSLCL